MKIKILILSSFLLLASFAIAAHAFADSEGKTADELIAGDQTDTTPLDVHDPWASREAQTGQKGKDILSVPMGDASILELLPPNLPEARNRLRQVQSRM